MGENQQVDQEVNSKNKKVLYSSGYAMILVTHTCFSTFSSVWFSFLLLKLFVWFVSFLLSTLLFYLLINSLLDAWTSFSAHLFCLFKENKPIS